MNRKTTFTIILLIMLATPLAAAVEQAYPACQVPVGVNQNCSMLTPFLVCDAYTYQVIDANGSIVEDNSLEELNESIYTFNFTQTYMPAGYIVRLCDNTTREVIVTEDDDQMLLGSLVLVPMLLSLVLLAGAATLDKQHMVLKNFLFLTSIIPFFSSMHFAITAIIRFYNWPEMQSAIGTSIYWVGITFTVIITYFLIYWLYALATGWKKKKEEQLNY